MGREAPYLGSQATPEDWRPLSLPWPGSAKAVKSVRCLDTEGTTLSLCPSWILPLLPPCIIVKVFNSRKQTPGLRGPKLQGHLLL